MFARFGKNVAELATPDKMVLGGKGAGLVRMSALGIPVPPGFTIDTSHCKAFEKLPAGAGQDSYVASLMPGVMADMNWLAVEIGYMPLVSVRSGAPVSMPGMMDTILNVGLTSKNFNTWEVKLGYRAARDSYRRLIQMLGSTAYGVPHEAFETILSNVKAQAKVKEDKELNQFQLDTVIDAFKKAFEAHVEKPFPDTVEEQVAAAIGAVFRSWNNERAKIYRTMNKIDPAMGTAVTVQAMVFGNMNDNSGSGVLFSRNPSTGANELYGEFLPNAQGEDVVAGIRTPLQLVDMQPLWPEVLDQLNEIACSLESEYKDMVDLEFTVQDKVLFMLQARAGKRGALAAFRIARDLVKEEVIDKQEAISRLTREQYKLTRQPIVDPKFKVKPDAQGLFGSMGVAVGAPVFSSENAVKAKTPVILVTHETDPDDVGGMFASKGILTATGGQTSHAAVVARGMNKPCVVGCVGIVDLAVAKKPKQITIDGATGRVWFDVQVPVIDNSADEAVAEIVSWIAGPTDMQKAVTSLTGIPATEGAFILASGWAHAQASTELGAIAGHKAKEKLVVDFRPAAEIVCPADSPLADLYCDQPGSVAADQSWLHSLLKTHGKKLAGLTVIGVPRSLGLEQFGIRVLAATVDSLEELLDGGDVVVGSKVTMTVGPTAFEKLAKLLEAAGRPIVSNAPDAPGLGVPVEYKVFQALAA